MSSPLSNVRTDKRLMAYSAAAMYGGAALDGAVEGVIPGDPSFAIAPALASAVVVTLLILFGPSLPRRALACLGPLGVGLIGYALSATPGAGDGAVLYMWPVLWTTFFFGRRGAVAIVLFVGIAHAVTLLELPAASSYPGRWVDVMVSVSVLAVVVLVLAERNDALLERLDDEARTDALTGLLNRRGFDERAALEMARARREHTSIALVAFDLDYFKRINDEWGHEVGDLVLAHVGELLASESRGIDVTARIGGEEFVVLLPGCDSEEAKVFSERVRAALAQGAEGLPTVRISAGLLATSEPRDIEQLLRGADSALYEAKRKGRDRTITFQRAAHPQLEVGQFAIRERG